MVRGALEPDWDLMGTPFEVTSQGKELGIHFFRVLTVCQALCWGHLDTILLQSCVVAMILFTDTEVQVRWLAPGHTAPLPDCIAPVLPFSLGASLWPLGPSLMMSGLEPHSLLLPWS